MPTLERLSPMEVGEVALALTSGRALVADFSLREWRDAISLMLPKLSEFENLGLVLVPFAEHASMPWQGSIAPGVVVKCSMVPRESVPDVSAAIQRLTSALVEPPGGYRMPDHFEEYMAYSDGCEREELEPHTYEMWVVHGRPEGPI